MCKRLYVCTPLIINAQRCANANQFAHPTLTVALAEDPELYKPIKTGFFANIKIWLRMTARSLIMRKIFFRLKRVTKIISGKNWRGLCQLKLNHGIYKLYV